MKQTCSEGGSVCLSEHNMEDRMSFAVVGVLLTLLRLLDVLDCVTFQPSHPIILQENIRAEIKCQHNDSALEVMLWYQRRPQSNNLSLIGYSYFGSDPNYEEGFKDRFEMTMESEVKGALVRRRAEANDSGEYFCAARESRTNYDPAYFGKGTKLTVLEPGCTVSPPTVVVLPPSEKECRDRKKQLKKTLVCVASGFYPDHVSVSWTVNGVPFTQGVASDHTALRVDKKYQITSRLRVGAQTWYTEGTIFNCNVSFFNGKDTIYTSAEVYGSGDVSGTKTEAGGMTREKFIKVTQTARLSYIILIVKNIVYGVFVTILAWKLGLGRSHATAKK